jgi:hypothetical protein
LLVQLALAQRQWRFQAQPRAQAEQHHAPPEGTCNQASAIHAQQVLSASAATRPLFSVRISLLRQAQLAVLKPSSAARLVYTLIQACVGRVPQLQSALVGTKRMLPAQMASSQMLMRQSAFLPGAYAQRDSM